MCPPRGDPCASILAQSGLGTEVPGSSRTAKAQLFSEALQVSPERTLPIFLLQQGKEVTGYLPMR